MTRLQDQDLEHHYVIEGRPAALRSVGPRHGSRQVRPEPLEVYNRVQPLKVVALRREFLQTLIDIKEPCLTPHPEASALPRASESRPRRKREVLGGVQLPATESVGSMASTAALGMRNINSISRIYAHASC